MISHDIEKSASCERQKTPKTRKSRRLLKVTLCLILVIAAVGAAFVGTLVLKYNRIVGAKPGKLQTKVRPGKLGRWVNPFVGTGGIPWGCGHNFPGAMVPFGMVRLKQGVNEEGHL